MFCILQLEYPVFTFCTVSLSLVGINPGNCTVKIGYSLVNDWITCQNFDGKIVLHGSKNDDITLHRHNFGTDIGGDYFSGFLVAM